MNLNIKSVFSNHRRETVRVNSGNDANTAVARCVLHMQINRYAAMYAEVYDEESGEVHASIRRSVTGTITIEYQRDPRQYERRLSLNAFKEL